MPRATRLARWILPAAVAAAAALFVVLIVPIDRRAPSIAALESDIDGSGRIDVLDAYALSRRRANDPAPASQQDIDALMARIVSLAQTESAL